MATELFTIKETGNEEQTLRVVRFWGGRKYKQMIQLSQGMNYITLTKTEMDKLIEKLESIRHCLPISV